MKKRIHITLCLAVLAIFSAKLHAQTPIKKNEPIAYRLGLNANLPFITSYTDSFKSRTGWGLWGEAEYYAARKWRIQPGFAYNSFGYTQNYFNDSGARQTRIITEHYFEIGSRFSFLPTPEESSARLVVGAAISFLAGRRTGLPDILGTNITNRTTESKTSFAPGLLLSAGFTAPLSKQIDLGMFYTQGLPSKIYPLDVVGRLGALQVKLSYKLIPAGGGRNFDGYGEETVMPLLYNPDSLAIVVRLKENRTRIILLEEQGYMLDAKEEELKTREENLAIMEAFKKKFTLVPVYYIYAGDSKTALAGNFRGILLNENLERDSTIDLPKKQYLFAEFARQFDEVSQTSGMYGLVVYDNRFKNLPPPFPAFVSNSYGFLSKEEVIGRFQKRLSKYFYGK